VIPKYGRESWLFGGYIEGRTGTLDAIDPSRDNVKSVVDEDTHTALRAKIAAGVRKLNHMFLILYWANKQ
jgi:hypothetical protein